MRENDAAPAVHLRRRDRARGRREVQLDMHAAEADLRDVGRGARRRGARRERREDGGVQNPPGIRRVVVDADTVRHHRRPPQTARGGPAPRGGVPRRRGRGPRAVAGFGFLVGAPEGRAPASTDVAGRPDERDAQRGGFQRLLQRRRRRADPGVYLPRSGALSGGHRSGHRVFAEPRVGRVQARRQGLGRRRRRRSEPVERGERLHGEARVARVLGRDDPLAEDARPVGHKLRPRLETSGAHLRERSRGGDLGFHARPGGDLQAARRVRFVAGGLESVRAREVFNRASQHSVHRGTESRVRAPAGGLPQDRHRDEHRGDVDHDRRRRVRPGLWQVQRKRVRSEHADADVVRAVGLPRVREAAPRARRARQSRAMLPDVHALRARARVRGAHDAGD
mmetsp:Transcript_5051/g.18034  ORF Transcript_5051/g.18034 Transcript_5051/m.18034 type:complete len:395 (+) Transcript_5051:715-1899(+)